MASKMLLNFTLAIKTDHQMYFMPSSKQLTIYVF